MLDHSDLRGDLFIFRETFKSVRRMDLSKGTLSDTSQENKMEEVDVAIKVHGLGESTSGITEEGVDIPGDDSRGRP